MEIVSAFFSGGQIVIEMLFASVNGNVSPQSTFSKQFQQWWPVLFNLITSPNDNTGVVTLFLPSLSKTFLETFNESAHKTHNNRWADCRVFKCSDK